MLGFEASTDSYYASRLHTAYDVKVGQKFKLGVILLMKMNVCE